MSEVDARNVGEGVIEARDLCTGGDSGSCPQPATTSTGSRDENTRRSARPCGKT